MKVYCPTGNETFDDETTKETPPEVIVAKLRDAEAMLDADKDLAAVLQALEVSKSTLDREPAPALLLLHPDRDRIR